MAIKPELQWVSENKILVSTIGVITNARIDHVEEMGGSPEEIARSLGNTVPKKGLLFTGDPRVAEILAQRARERETKLIFVQALGSKDIGGVSPDLVSSGAAGSPWWLENAGIALAVAESCGIERDIALRGLAKARPDPGAARFIEPWKGIRCLDASAANDPESLLELVGSMIRPESELLFVYNNRQDRLPRLLTFLNARLPGKMIVTGANPGLLLWRKARPRSAEKNPCQTLNYRPNEAVHFVPTSRLEAELKNRMRCEFQEAGSKPALVLCGNTKGWPIDLYGDR
jgi:poly-gamma-glutamate synthase PgsB/CapB